MSFIPGLVPPSQFEQARWLVFSRHRLLVEGETGAIPVLPDPASLGLEVLRTVFIGTFEDAPCFAVETGPEAAAPAGLAWENLRAVFPRWEEAWIAAASRASQLLDWDRDHRFCGRCATPTVASAHEHSRACPSCGHLVYPRISPVMMALVKRGRELLLARGPHFPEGMFSALAGFVEAGESVEETLVREVREEVGIEVANLRYFGSQSWPFPHSLMLAFVCDYAGGDITPQPGEIAEAHWFDVAHLPTIPMTMSVAGRMIRAVAAELEGAAR